ncbi:complement decay-accelerating factor isoform X2 [Onychomys torridus]|uniref:complement decay-accelerating factor isoform X2 n=1 Tax=Onychomys torridus TaxID=38674 RepID=UPI00167FB48F|nr:complement decay-accelerating factor isoform X2 [Onychomys torridus]
MGRARAPGTRSPPPPLLRQLLLLSSLLLLSPTVRGDCGQPPEIPNATPEVDGKTSFPKQSTVVYLCNKGFHKVPGKEDTAMCLENGQWSTLETFCNKSCDAPTRVFFAHPKKEYNNLNYFPIGTTVEYECRPGFRRLPLLSGISTCLESLEWSKLAEICKKKSCSNPGEIKNGHINIITNILFGSEIRFSCDTGYRLVGSTSSFCSLSGNTVEWSDPFPVCTEIFCSDPPEIKNGHIQEESDTYTYRHAVIYVCAKGFVLVGKKSIYCTVEDDQGKWSDPAPQCIEKSMIPSTSPKPTTVNVSGTRVSPTSQKPTTVNVPDTRVSPTSQKTTTVNVPGTRVLPTSQKPTTVNVPGTRVSPTSQKPTTVNVPGTRVSPTSQKPTTVNVPGTRVPPASQKPTTVNVPGTRVLPTSQKPTTVNVPGTRVLPTSQKPTTVNVPGTRVSPTSQKPTTVNVPVTQRVPATKTTTHRPPGTSKEKERSTSGGNRLIYGLVAVPIVIDSILILKTSWTLFKSDRSSDFQEQKSDVTV